MDAVCRELQPGLAAGELGWCQLISIAVLTGLYVALLLIPLWWAIWRAEQ